MPVQQGLYQRRIYTATQGSDQTTATTYSVWPNAAYFTPIVIPANATHAAFVFYVSRVYQNTGANGELWLRPQIGSTLGREFYMLGSPPVWQISALAVADEIALGALAGTSSPHPPGRQTCRPDVPRRYDKPGQPRPAIHPAMTASALTMEGAL